MGTRETRESVLSSDADSLLDPGQVTSTLPQFPHLNRMGITSGGSPGRSGAGVSPHLSRLDVLQGCEVEEEVVVREGGLGIGDAAVVTCRKEDTGTGGEELRDN